MRTTECKTARVQVYLTDPKLVAALNREARRERAPLSQAAGRAIARGLHRTNQPDADDRLLNLDRALRDHMRAMARDVQIIEELLVEPLSCRIGSGQRRAAPPGHPQPESRFRHIRRTWAGPYRNSWCSHHG